MAEIPKLQLSDEQRLELRAIVKQVVRDKLARREELQDQVAVMREIWRAMLQSRTWEIVQSEKPPDMPTLEEIWSMTPIVKKGP